MIGQNDESDEVFGHQPGEFGSGVRGGRHQQRRRDERSGRSEVQGDAPHRRALLDNGACDLGALGARVGCGARRAAGAGVRQQVVGEGHQVQLGRVKPDAANAPAQPPRTPQHRYRVAVGCRRRHNRPTARRLCPAVTTAA